MEEEGAGRRWSVEKAFGVLDCLVDGIVDAGGDKKGEEARVEVPLTSREAIMICTWVNLAAKPRKAGKLCTEFFSHHVRYIHICMYA